MSELVRIRKIFTKTNGDWFVVELEDGRRFKFGNFTRRAQWTLLREQLETTEIRSDVRQSVSPGAETYPLIDSIEGGFTPGLYEAIYEGKPIFAIDARDAKTLLYDTSP